MTRIELDRREFLKGCCAAATVGAAGPALFFSGDANAAANGYDTIVHVFLRGGIDGLNLVFPVSGEDRNHYEESTPAPARRSAAKRRCRSRPAAAPPASACTARPAACATSGRRQAAIVHCCGMQTRSRAAISTPSNTWISARPAANQRHRLARAGAADQPGVPSSVVMPALAVNSRMPANMLGATGALTMGSPTDFQLNGGAWAWQAVRQDSPAGFKGVRETLASLWQGNVGIEHAGRAADAALRTVARQAYTATLPDGWPSTNFARQLWTVAQSIRFDLGLRYAALDVGGWDTHESQGNDGGGYYRDRVAELSAALAAFYGELTRTGEMARVTVVVQSGSAGVRGQERRHRPRLQQPPARPRRPGERRPLLRHLGGAASRPCRPTSATSRSTDYRRVFAELLHKRMGHATVDQVFPGFGNHTPLGLFAPASASASATPRAVAPGPVRQPPRQVPQPALADIRTTSAPAEVAGEAASAPIRHRRGTVHLPKLISQPLLRLRLRLYRLMQEHRL